MNFRTISTALKTRWLLFISQFNRQDSGEIPDDIIREYNKTRESKTPHIICHAPFVSLNFEQTGKVNVCCYNRSYVLGKYPEDNLREMWFSEKANALRQAMLDHDFSKGCAVCRAQLMNRNFYGTRARHLDIYDIKLKGTGNRLQDIEIGYPRVLEFELTNTCNLECIMCNGYFSSSIRKNREKKAPLHSPWDSRFVEQLAEFLPHVSDAKFLGGEPFLIDIYYEIWEKIRDINPGILIHITTNGTILNQRAKSLMERLRCGIVISIDSLEKQTYESIRVNARFERVMDNLQYFRDYTRRKNTWLSFAICPMTRNWHELPAMVDFCTKNDITVFFNTVFKPEEFSLRALAPAALEQVIRHLENHSSTASGKYANLNHNSLKDLANMLKGWLSDRKKQEKDEKIAESLIIQTTNQPDGTLHLSPEASRVFSLLVRHINDKNNIDGGDPRAIVDQHIRVQEKLVVELKAILKNAGQEGYLELFREILLKLSEAATESGMDVKSPEDMTHTLETVKEAIFKYPMRNTIIDELFTSKPLFIMGMLIKFQPHELLFMLKKGYPA